MKTSDAASPPDEPSSELRYRDPEHLPQFMLRLPGAWWPVPLTDHDAARAAIRKLIGTRLPGDEFAPVRVAAERRFLAGLDQAITGAGQAMYVAVSIAPQIPIPVTALVLTPTQQLTPAIGTDPEATMKVLLAGLERRPGVWHRFATSESQVARRVRRETVDMQVKGADEVDHLAVEYYLTVPGTKRFVTVVFSGPIGPLHEMIIDMFDAIIRASYWSVPESSGGGDVMRAAVR